MELLKIFLLICTCLQFGYSKPAIEQKIVKTTVGVEQPTEKTKTGILGSKNKDQTTNEEDETSSNIGKKISELMHSLKRRKFIAAINPILDPRGYDNTFVLMEGIVRLEPGYENSIDVVDKFHLNKIRNNGINDLDYNIDKKSRRQFLESDSPLYNKISVTDRLNPFELRYPLQSSTDSSNTIDKFANSQGVKSEIAGGNNTPPNNPNAFLHNDQNSLHNSNDYEENYKTTNLLEDIRHLYPYGGNSVDSNPGRSRRYQYYMDIITANSEESN